MSKIAFLLTLLVTVFVGLLPAAPAQALAGRTFVSAAGSDSNNCTNVATPCRHLAAAYAATAANGEIYVLDPANYGSLTITGPVSIEGHGWASIAPVSGSAAISINAPGATDKINIIGVVLDGTAITNTTGIQFNSGGSLNVRDSVIRNFSNDGIAFEPTSSTANKLYVSNTLVSDNGNIGIFINFQSSGGTTTGVFDHVQLENNAVDGMRVANLLGTINATVSDSLSTDNGSDGIFCPSGGTGLISIMVRNSTIANNGATGLAATNCALRLTRSAITGNVTGWTGLVSSYDDNNIDGNTSSTTPPAIVYR